MWMNNVVWLGIDLDHYGGSVLLFRLFRCDLSQGWILRNVPFALNLYDAATRSICDTFSRIHRNHGTVLGTAQYPTVLSSCGVNPRDDLGSEGSGEHRGSTFYSFTKNRAYHDYLGTYLPTWVCLAIPTSSGEARFIPDDSRSM